MLLPLSICGRKMSILQQIDVPIERLLAGFRCSEILHCFARCSAFKKEDERGCGSARRRLNRRSEGRRNDSERNLFFVKKCCILP